MSGKDAGTTKLVADLIELLVKLVELRRLGHHVPVHEERRLDLLVPAFTEKVKSVCNQSMVQIDAIVGEEVASVSRDLRS